MKSTIRVAWSTLALAALTSCGAETEGEPSSSSSASILPFNGVNNGEAELPDRSPADADSAAGAEGEASAAGAMPGEPPAGDNSSIPTSDEAGFEEDATLVDGVEQGGSPTTPSQAPDVPADTEEDTLPEQPLIDGELPLVYEVEDTGADCPRPELPGYDQLPAISALPDPFLLSSGERMQSRADWRCRRAEIRGMLEEYDVGFKPERPERVDALLDGDTIRIVVGEGTSSFEMTATLNRPANAPDGPIPAIIGINSPTGSLPGNLFSSRGIATITYNADQLATTSFNNNPRTGGNFYQMYPGATAGYMIRWAWGVSRLIDALEQLPEVNLDLSRLAISGCSFQGKIALYAGAFDERIALTLPHESGGGGTISWRYSDMLERRDNTEVENLLHAQGAPWYAESLRQFTNTPDRLPFDHHELMAMVAPRAMLAIESTAIARMGAEAARVDALAAREVYTALGVPDRLGATEENVNHCVWHDGFTPDVEAYLDKFLLGDESVNTDILRSRFEIDTDTWIPWSTPEQQ